MTRPVAGRLKTLGDLSYAISLVHVPMQMALLLCLDLFLEGTRSFTASPLTLPIHIAMVIWVSLILHHRFEKPAGAFLRRTLSRNPRQPSSGVSVNHGR
ncbi:MAG: hypothetical protein HLUCCA08_00285 [Rhodobacteraceae bacterium HLUCCA08]|nr:MAG: hypothetical protein HLUCCA08_00285 [Rhodobacteraceae bacterium HLUCCA08]